MKAHKKKHIRDPIHGSIELSEAEVKLLDTPQMQRLRNIKQNGLCYLVYPALNLTRFEHSLGVMHLAGKLGTNIGLESDDINILRAAGLLHDVGHCALSHTSDDLLELFSLTHEKIAADIINREIIGDILEEQGIDKKKISSLIIGEDEGILGEIISSESDIDKMDYLIRDSYHAGVAYGVIDSERIIRTVKIVEDNRGAQRIALDYRGLEALESLLIGRNMMFQTVYRHHAKRIAEAMVSNVLVHVFNTKNKLKQFLKFDDISLFSYMRKTRSEYARDIFKRIEHRRLFKSVFAEKIEPIHEMFRKELKNNKRKIEKKICNDMDIPEGYLLLDMPQSKLPDFKLLIDDRGTLKKIFELSEIARALGRSEMEKLTFCVYIDPKYRSRVENLNMQNYIEYSQKSLTKFL